MVDDPGDATIFKVFVSDGTSIFDLPAIEHQGKLWLVPQWLESTDGVWIRPALIISTENLHVQDLRGKGHAADFAVNAPIPKAVLEGRVRSPEAAGYVMVERPELRFRKPSIH